MTNKQKLTKSMPKLELNAYGQLYK